MVSITGPIWSRILPILPLSGNIYSRFGIACQGVLPRLPSRGRAEGAEPAGAQGAADNEAIIWTVRFTAANAGFSEWDVQVVRSLVLPIPTSFHPHPVPLSSRERGLNEREIPLCPPFPKGEERNGDFPLTSILSRKGRGQLLDGSPAGGEGILWLPLPPGMGDLSPFLSSYCEKREERGPAPKNRLINRYIGGILAQINRYTGHIMMRKEIIVAHDEVLARAGVARRRAAC